MRFIGTYLCIIFGHKLKELLCPYCENIGVCVRNGCKYKGSIFKMDISKDSFYWTDEI